MIRIVESGRKITISQGTRRLVVGASRRLVFGMAAQGPAGPPGPAGQTYNHVQETPALVWTISHNLGIRPNVSVYTDGGIQRFVQVVAVTDDIVEIRFNSEKTGTAHLS